MDIPTTRLQTASIEGGDVLDFIDTEFRQLLMRLNPNEIKSGQPVLVTRDQNQNIVVYAMSSDYELGPMVIHRAVGILRRRLADRGIWPMYLTLAYQGESSWFLGTEQVDLQPVVNSNYENLVMTSRLV